MKKILIASISSLVLAAAVAAPAGGGVVEPVGLVYAPKDCTTPKIEPNRITLTCGDAGALLKHMEWSEWGGEPAKGTGELSVNDCDPNCAEGTFHSYGAKVKLLNIKRDSTCAGQTLDMYGRAHIRFIGEVPPRANSLRSFKLFCES